MKIIDDNDADENFFDAKDQEENDTSEDEEIFVDAKDQEENNSDADEKDVSKYDKSQVLSELYQNGITKFISSDNSAEKDSSDNSDDKDSSESITEDYYKEYISKSIHAIPEKLQSAYNQSIEVMSGPAKSLFYLSGGAAVGYLSGGVGLACYGSSALTTPLALLASSIAGGAISSVAASTKDEEVAATLAPILKRLGVEDQVTYLRNQGNSGEIFLNAAKALLNATAKGFSQGYCLDQGGISGGINSVITHVGALANNPDITNLVNCGNNIVSEETDHMTNFKADWETSTTYYQAILYTRTASYMMGFFSALGNLLGKKNGLKTILNVFAPDRKSKGLLIGALSVSLATFFATALGLVPAICLGSAGMLVGIGFSNSWDKKIVNGWKAVTGVFKAKESQENKQKTDEIIDVVNTQNKTDCTQERLNELKGLKKIKKSIKGFVDLQNKNKLTEQPMYKQAQSKGTNKTRTNG